jgi:phage terminase large subunit-like protein
MNWVLVGRQYAHDVINGTIPTCRWVRLACERSESDFNRFAAADAPYYFDAEAANGACDFLASLRHVQDSIGTKAGDPFTPLPWQVWVVTTIFGWRWRDTGTRRFRRAFIEEGRGNGKSTMAAGMILYAVFAEGVRGAQGICAASLRDQARIVLDTARTMVEQNDALREALGLVVAANKITQPATGSRLWALPAKAASAEGLSLNVGCLDEVHAQRGRALHDSLASGCSKRADSLFLMVTTAGDDVAGIAYEIHSFLERLLTGEAEDDSFFAALYTIDAKDEWTAPASWRKANPSWGVSVDPRALAEECKRAQQMPGARANFRIKHLCEWIQNGGDTPFLDDRAIKRCLDPTLDDAHFTGEECVYGADLASRLDMCSVYRVHARRRADKKIHYYVFGKNFVPESARKGNNTSAYAEWEERKELVVTAGNTTDQDAIEAFLVDAMSRLKVRDISFDPLQSSMLMTHLEKRGATTVDVAQSAKNLTPGVLELQEAVADGRLSTNSQVLVWALGNLKVRTIGSNMLQPIRPIDHAQKIDPAVALIMALRSVALTPFDEAQQGPRIFMIDNLTGEITTVGGAANR